MTEQGEYPPWDGQHLAEVPENALTDPFEFLIRLGKRKDFPEGINRRLVELFTASAFKSSRACELSVHPEGFAIVSIWLPFFADERMYQAGDHTALSEQRRWWDTETAIAVLARAGPKGPVLCGFRPLPGEPRATPWYHYCRRYQHPPECVVGSWHEH